MKIISAEKHEITIGMGEAGTPLPLVMDIRVEYTASTGKDRELKLTLSMEEAIKMTKCLNDLLDKELVSQQRSYQKQVNYYTEMREKLAFEGVDDDF